jgi:hypothetical protein
MTEVHVVGGKFDGMIGSITQECMDLRFFVHPDADPDDEDTYWYGFFWDGIEYDDENRPIFRPQRPTNDP